MIDRHINSLASWLSRPTGFLATCLVIATGVGAGAMLSFNDHWVLVFNLALSVAAILFAGTILVAGAKDTTAIQAKLDELLKAADAADDRLIGLDQRTAEEVEHVREKAGALRSGVAK